VIGAVSASQIASTASRFSSQISRLSRTVAGLIPVGARRARANSTRPPDNVEGGGALGDAPVPEGRQHDSVTSGA
jgi:hypothetical protein